MIIDSHVHYSEGNIPGRPYDPEGFVIPPCPSEFVLDSAKAAGVDKIVQVTPSKMGTDNRYSVEEAAEFPDSILGLLHEG